MKKTILKKMCNSVNTYEKQTHNKLAKWFWEELGYCNCFKNLE